MKLLNKMPKVTLISLTMIIVTLLVSGLMVIFSPTPTPVWGAPTGPNTAACKAAEEQLAKDQVWLAHYQKVLGLAQQNLANKEKELASDQQQLQTAQTDQNTQKSTMEGIKAQADGKTIWNYSGGKWGNPTITISLYNAFSFDMPAIITKLTNLQTQWQDTVDVLTTAINAIVSARINGAQTVTIVINVNGTTQTIAKNGFNLAQKQLENLLTKAQKQLTAFNSGLAADKTILNSYYTPYTAAYKAYKNDQKTIDAMTKAIDELNKEIASINNRIAKYTQDVANYTKQVTVDEANVAAACKQS